MISVALDDHPMNLYLWIKALHLWFVVGWMATVLALPLLIEGAVAEDGKVDGGGRARFAALGRRVYRIGHHLFGWAFAYGLFLWVHFGMGGRWLYLKLALVAVLLGHFTVSGRWIKRIAAGGANPPPGVLRWHGIWPMLVLGAVLWLVIAKPFLG